MRRRDFLESSATTFMLTPLSPIHVVPDGDDADGELYPVVLRPGGAEGSEMELVVAAESEPGAVNRSLEYASTYVEADKLRVEIDTDTLDRDIFKALRASGDLYAAEPDVYRYISVEKR